MTYGRLLTASLAAVLVACPNNQNETSGAGSVIDAGALPAALTSARHRFRLRLLPGWIVVPPAVARPPLEQVAAARRTATTAPFEISPRIEVTAEPTLARDPESAFQGIKADIEGLDRQPSVQLLRSSLGFRPVGPEMVGDLNVRYRVGGAEGRQVRHRSLLVWRPGPSGEATVLSITATFLARDLERVAPEVQRMFTNLELLPAPDGGIIR